MLLTNVPSWALCIAMIAAVLELAAASHFRGAIIQWRPVDPGNFDGRVLFTHRIAWRRSSTEGGDCDASTVAAATLIGGGNLTCRIGCSGNIGSLQYQCTNFNVAEDWSAGEGSNEFNISGVSSFEASYTSCCWITLVQGGGSWEVRVKGDLTPRADNGRINSSPTTAVPPVLTLRHGATHTITIPVSDADGDIVRCKWAESALSECAGVCQVFPATLDQDNCTLTYNANGALGIYAVALQVEDFINASSTVAMSSVPFQFLVQIQEITIPPGVTDPTFVGTTPADGSSIAVGSSYQERITARSGGDNATIVDIITVFPPGLMRSNLTVLNSRESYIDVTWTPSPSQQGLNSFCYAAIDNFGLTSPTRCITLAVGVCEVNEYIHPTSGVCAACPTDSTSAGGTPSMCTCNAGTGRVNETDVTLPCLDCPGPPETPSLVSDVPPNAALSWSPPPASGAWSYTYEISWANESIIVPRQAGTTGQIPGLQAETEYTVVVTAYSDSTLCPEQSEPFMFNTSQRCPSPAPMFTGPPTVQPGVVSVNWTAAGSSDPLVTRVRYALYSQCGAETTFQLIDDDIQGLSFNITTLPSLTQCVLRVVVYSDHCLLDVDGPLGATTDKFTTVCEVNEYVHPTSGVCAACPSDSTSAGGTPSMCTCNAGTGRVNETDVTLPCLVCPGLPETPSLVSDVPPNPTLSWSPPSASGAWKYTYAVSWTNGSVIVTRQAGTTGQITGLQAETQYTVEITAYPDSTLCQDQSAIFTFMTSQRCPNPAPMFSDPPTVQPGVVSVSWTAAGSSDPLVTVVRYALYSQCGADTTFQLIDDDIQGLSYNITALPILTQCVLRVVVYSDHCLLDVDGPHGSTTDNFTTVCEVNEYVHPTLGVCAACPTNSTSAGGTPSMCTCIAGTGRVNNSDVTLPCLVCEVNEYVHPTSGVCAACPTNSTSARGTPSMCNCNIGTGRVNEADVTLPCLACPGPPETTSLDSSTSVPPNVDLSWSPPSASGAWSYTYEVSWTNGSVIVPRQADTTGQIPGLQAETEYTVEITAYPNSTLCPNQSMSITFNTTQRCPSPAPKFSGPPTVQPGVVRVSWTAAGSSDPLVTGVRYALYSQCGAETTFQLIDDDIQGLSNDITTLPSLTQCVLRVVVYSDHCLLDVNGLLVDTTDNFTTVCEVNEYIHPNSGVCAACPTNSTSAGGTPSMCTCNAGTGRVNESDVTLPCLACPGLPETPSIVSDIPPNSNLSWSPPSASGAWSYTYEVSWTNGSVIVPRQAGTTGQIPGLQAETEYTVEITAYPDSTLCPDQSTTFVFMTDQRCPSPAPMFTGPPTVQPGVVRVSWTAAGSTDPLVTGVRYALYSQCGPETTFQLIDDDIQGLSYDITTLHSLTQCVLRVVVYSNLCLLDVDGLLGDTTDKFTTVCPVNEYVGGSPETCQPCPANSSSPGGVVRVCPCMDGYGRVNESDPSTPCVACPGPPLNPRLKSPVPPIVEIQWDRPTTPDPWSFMYRIDWQNGTSAVGDTTNTRRILSGLEAVTQYTVTISAFTDSTVCAKQSVNITFSTTQRCPDTGPQVRPSSEILPGIATVTWEAAQTNDRLLTTGILYAVYSLCGSKSSSYQLVAEAIEGLSYTVTGLPAPAQCTLRVVAYHRYCLQDLDGVLSDETLPFTTAIAAPEQPPPPTITVGDGGFTIDGLSPKGVVVEYVCNYTSVITGVTSQVRMKPNETADVSLEKVGGYVVQCAGVNGDNYQGAFSEPVTITLEPPETREGSPQRSAIDPLVVSLSVIGVAVAVNLLVVLVGAVIQAKIRRKKKGEQGDIPIESL